MNKGSVGGWLEALLTGQSCLLSLSLQRAHKWGSKEVDRSLYGSRDYASEDPGLSPITEGLGGSSPSATLQQQQEAQLR